MKPSQKAFDEGFVTPAPTGRGQGFFYLWHRDRTIHALEAAGLGEEAERFRKAARALEAQISQQQGPDPNQGQGQTLTQGAGFSDEASLGRIQNS